MLFTVSGVEVSPVVPVAVAFVVAAVTAPAGVSGAFLLLPFQVSILGFTSPAVSATNLLYNAVATPGAIARYRHDGVLAWPLTRLLVGGTLPGVVLGGLLRVRYLDDPETFKIFAAVVLGSLAVRLLTRGGGHGGACAAVASGRGRAAIVALALGVGLVGGIYGIGGGAVLAPLLVGVGQLPVRVVAGAALVATFVTSVAGVASFQLLAVAADGAPVAPDWALGALFGVGGLAGGWVGAWGQRFLPERVIRLVLGVLVAALALTYVAQSVG